MGPRRPAWAYGSHKRGDIREATNQAPPLVGHNVITVDAALVEAITRHASADLVDELMTIGAQAGSAAARAQGLLANQNPPTLAAYDCYGRRIDEVVSTRRGTG